MILGFASDHRGFSLKEELIKYFKSRNYEIIDYGTNNCESSDYPDFAYKLGRRAGGSLISVDESDFVNFEGEKLWIRFVLLK